MFKGKKYNLYYKLLLFFILLYKQLLELIKKFKIIQERNG